MCYCVVLQCVFKLHIKTTIVIKYINEQSLKITITLHCSNLALNTSSSSL